MNKTSIVMVFAFFACIIGHSQGIFTGKVLDENSAPLPGASVVIKGSSKGVATDFDGNFQIGLNSENDVLLVSYIGYIPTEFPTSGKTSAEIVLLPDSEKLNEVVVTALGITRAEKKIGYATQKMDVEIIEEINAPNVGNLFTGQVAGLSVSNPTGLFQKPSFSLRGKSPLIVIDGIPVETDFYDVSANNIANVNVLKGTTASALYGSRGRNGAILITTKNAKVDGLEITVSHNTMISAGFTVFPETQTEYGNGSNGKYEFWDGKDGGISDGDMIWGPKFEPGVLVSQWNSPILDNVTGETIPWWGDVYGTQYDDKSRYSRVPTPWEYHDNLKDFMGTGYISSTDFAIASKSEKGSFRLSGNYSDQKDRVPNSGLKTGGLTFKSTTNLSKSLTLDSKLSYNKVYSPNYPRHGYGPKNHMYTILIWMGDDVNGQELKEHMYVPGQEGYRQANFNYAWYNNVYFAANELNQKYDADLINAQMVLKYNIAEGLNLQGRGSAVIQDIFEDRQSPKTYLNYGDAREGDYKTWNSKRLTVDYDVLASYNKSLTEDISFDVNAGASTFYRKYQQEYNSTDGLVVPFVYSLNNTSGNVAATTYVEERATNSVYATLGLDLYNAVFLTAAARNDWSSTLPKENRSYFYPSVSLSTVVSNFVSMPKAVDYLKLYGSWAQVSSDLDPYSTESYYTNSGVFGGNIKLQYPNGLVNSNIEPESSNSFELGLSAAFLKNRLALDLTYYNVVDTNQIIDLPISNTSGFENRKVNGNEYTTNGLEVVLNAKPILTDNFSWNITANWSRKVQKITEIYGDNTTYNNLRLNDRADSYYATVWQKSADGDLILGANGLPVKDNFPQLLGHNDQDWTLGLQNSFKYKNLTVNVGIDGGWGGLIRSLTVEKMWWGGKHPNSTEYRDAEYAAGVPVYVPNGVQVTGGDLVQDVNGDVISDTRTYAQNTTAVSWQTWSQNYPYRAAVTYKENEKFANIFDRSFFKLRTLSFKYDITELANIHGVKNLDVTLSGYNLLVWKKADIIDPDFGNDNNLQDPSTRYIGIGVNVKF
ncbi:SusC/RagA family TonB-linked outer membrane protein [Arenibacter sp. ARW7G5Y1]|uniref:SusC/RagA family TonB-linked outer membrane protein n=1 Tax=Arenibacter sp. ARW7G5Y1 TaxID=2135619 RepID=UPI000D77081C|nr:SusC/RagA family TonB-linked outer membrane protein [Arenibacter sp. ARW7G5Y1]PXX31317.1 TonB-linked SusC/RagA family outer membrane protein [Arenibacter sp. ARW7G5Y1]